MKQHKFNSAIFSDKKYDNMKGSIIKQKIDKKEDE